MRFSFRPDQSEWPKLVGMAAMGSLATSFLARNLFSRKEKDPPFTVGHLLGPSLVKGNKITMLENGNQIFPAMLEAIRTTVFSPLAVDHFFVNSALHPVSVAVHASSLTRAASDHFPPVAELILKEISG